MKNKIYCIKGLISGTDNLYFWVRTLGKELCKFKTRQEAWEYIDKVLNPYNEGVTYFIKELEEECAPKYVFSYEELYQLLDEAVRYYSEYAATKESDEFIKELINDYERD